MPLLPAGPPPAGGLAMPPPGAMPMGAPMPPPLTPAGAGADALSQLAVQQEAQRAQWAQEAMAVALQAIAAIPNPDAMAAQSEPSGLVPPGDSGQGDPSMQGGY